MWYLLFFLFLSYLIISIYSLIRSASPAIPCHHSNSKRQCFRPLVSPGETLQGELWLYKQLPGNGTKMYIWSPVDTCRFNFTAPESGTLAMQLTSNKTSCEVPLPNAARRRSSNPKLVRPLKARFVFRLADGKEFGGVHFELTRVKQRSQERSWTGSSSSAARNLLTDKPTTQQQSSSKSSDNSEALWIPYLKYGQSPVRIRFVSEYSEYGILQRADGVQLHAWNHSHYRPMMYVDDLSLQHSSQIELAPPEDKKPPIKLQVRLGSVSPVLDSLNRQILWGFSTVESIFPAEDLDEIRYFLQDERLYRFFLTQIISYLHMWFSYLAFRDEIRFYRGKNNMLGVSASTVITRLICSVIIFLYLVDGGGTSWVVLLSIFSECVVEAWKAFKLLQPTFTPTHFPFVSIRQLQTEKERETVEYDHIAMKYLAMVFYPLVAAWSLFALQNYEYKSWYSWLISNLANAVYTFGFITMCPQLYVNYRLKSVAHLPWKVFMYKMFNTFVDDAFAFLIEMPWKHRLMTLRDDVVFVLFLVQVYIYRVDKTRTNEFGYSYEDEPVDQLKQEKKEKQA